MFETSGDLLRIVIAFCILWFTIFVCWGMYYFISMLRTTHKMIKSVNDKLETVDKILKLIKEKLEKGSSHMALLSDSMIKLVGFMIEKNAKSKKTTTTTRGKKKK